MSSSALPLDVLRVVGQRVEIECGAHAPVVGRVFACDAQSDCVVLQEDSSGGGASAMRFIALASVTRVVAHAPADANELAQFAATPLTPLAAARTAEREAKSIARILRDVAKLGVGVSPQVQAIFNALAKT